MSTNKERRDEIAHSLEKIQEQLTSAVTLIVVTKTFPVEDIEILYSLGIRNFGENRIEELEVKSPLIPDDVQWHFLGQVQGKKINRIVKYSDVIHSLDSLEHAEKFQRAIQTQHKELDFFLQVNLEEARNDRGGVEQDQIRQFLSDSKVRVSGLMTVLPIEMNPSEGFSRMKNLQKELYHQGYANLRHLSMGMSGDYVEAMRHGATHIRLGSSILGSRPAL